MKNQLQANPAGLELVRGTGSTAVVRLFGSWHVQHGMHSAAELGRELEAGGVRQISFDARELEHWDSSLVAFLDQLTSSCRSDNVEVDTGNLPKGAARLLSLAQAVPARHDASTRAPRLPLLEGVGKATLTWLDGLNEFLEFMGKLSIAFAAFVRGRARYRRVDLITTIQQCGAEAFGIVTLISFLVGVIVAFMGAVQLQKFGASIYVADLVAIGILREMGAMMAGIIMAGRTGAAFAAQLGTMKVTQETDALSTLGISPMEFLVVPRVIALIIMMPLLCVYADLLGILGGATIGATMLGLSFASYMRETVAAVQLGDFFGGLFKSCVYGALVAIAGCLRGLQCGRSASSVGAAATSAVVTGIVSIVGACGAFAVIFNILGF